MIENFNGYIIFMFYEHLVREWPALMRLKSLLESKGAKVFVFSAMVEKNKAYLKSILHKPDIVFMPWLTAKPYEAIVYPFVKRNPKVRIIDFHHEELTEPDGVSYFIPQTVYGKNAEFHLAWSERFKNLLQTNKVNNDQIFVTGNIRCDLLKKASVTRDFLSKAYNLDLKKKWILFAESRGYYQQRKSKAEINQLLDDGVTIEEIEQRMEFEENSFEAFFEDINHLPDYYQEKYELIYRPHPGTYSLAKMPHWVKTISERAISDWIGNCDFFVSCGSTTIFEAEIMKVPCAIYDRYPTPPERMIEGLEQYPTINSLEEINDELIQRIRNETGEIYLAYLGKADGKVGDRIVEVVEKILDSKYDANLLKYSSSVEKNSLYKQMKIFIYEILAWILVKTSIVEKLKKPNSIYLLLNDIPYNKRNTWINDFIPSKASNNNEK